MVLHHFGYLKYFLLRFSFKFLTLERCPLRLITLTRWELPAFTHSKKVDKPCDFQLFLSITQVYVSMQYFITNIGSSFFPHYCNFMQLSLCNCGKVFIFGGSRPVGGRRKFPFLLITEAGCLF